MAENIELVYVNFRYLTFRADGNYYLLDRKPRYVIPYFFFPFSWLFKQKFYSISEEEYLRLVQSAQSKGTGVAIPASLTGGLAVVSSALLRRSGIIEQLGTGFSHYATIFIIGFLALSAFAAVWLFHHFSQKRLTAFLPLKGRKISSGRICPQAVSMVLIKRTFAHVMLWLLTLFIGAVAFYSNNWFFLLSAFFMLCFMLCISVGSYSPDIRYRFKAKKEYYEDTDES
ncbi:DUF443 family protein [Streptococcus sp. H31]|uniref:DUF443 family protein n=1 Tax=Streptococcus huangxiaojuni TaxID=3237239 RepID=UPI0034A491F9